ncbi:MAG: DNA polymerase III subunit gamma/tau [Acidimicrobiia bacterium]|nr:DNA polymerase III subunit gamma/tau [Acidimicrobiia bacterium]
MAEYRALYRKYRPQTFDEVVGQSHVTTTLSREVSDGHVAHAYLFAGPRGTGKTTTARILAKTLNCANRLPDGSPDNDCDSCVAITEGSSFDVLELDAASHNSVDDIREMRVSVTTVASTGTGRRVFILDEAHMLSKAAGNALLKTLEEPPEHVHFVLATTEPYKLLDTVRSRTQRFDFHSVSIESLAAHLAKISDLEGFKTEPAALIAVARHAAGSVRDSLSLLEQVAALGDSTVDLNGVNRALGLADQEAYAALTAAIADQDAQAGLELVARLAGEGVDLRRFAAESVGFLRGVFLAHYAPNLAEVADEPEEVLEHWRKAAARLPAGDVLRGVDLLGEALIKLREGREERLMLELAMIKLTRPETSTDSEALLSRMDRLERKISGLASAPAATAPVEKLAPQPAPTPTVEQPIEPPLDPPQSVPDLDEQLVAAAAPLAGEPESTAAAEGLTIEKFRSVWPQLFGGLRDLLGARRWALFRETEPMDVRGSTLVVGVRHGFHLKSLEADPAAASIVATRAGDLLGGVVTVVFAPADGSVPVVEDGRESRRATPQPESEPERVPDQDQMDEAPDDLTDPFKLIEDELGGTVVDESDGDS